MSKKKDKERALREGPYRQEPPKPRGICVVEGCDKLVYIEEGKEPPKPRGICVVEGCDKLVYIEEGKVPLCPECMAFLRRLAWFMPRMKIEQAETKEGLVLPGHKDYKATLDGKEVKP